VFGFFERLRDTLFVLAEGCIAEQGDHHPGAPERRFSDRS
jgi:hypothetical protein